MTSEIGHFRAFCPFVRTRDACKLQPELMQQEFLACQHENGCSYFWTDLLRIITSTADELSEGTNIDDLERPW